MSHLKAIGPQLCSGDREGCVGDVTPTYEDEYQRTSDYAGANPTYGGCRQSTGQGEGASGGNPDLRHGTPDGMAASA